MGKTIYIPENKISLLREYFTRGEIDGLGENFFVFFRDKFFIFNSNSDVLKNAEELIHLLNDAGLDYYAYNLENFLALNGPKRFSNYAYISLKDVPRILCGTINGNDLHLSNNIFYDVLNSPEFKKLASSNSFSNIYVGSESGTRDKLVFSSDSSEKTLGNKYIPSTLYHGTILKNAIGIVTKGLRPSPERSNFTDKGIYHADTVFLSKDVTTACAYSSMFSHSFITDINLLPVVIEYDVNKMDKSRIILDFDLYASHGNGKDKPYEKVLRGVDEVDPIRAQRIRVFNRKSETVDVLKDDPLKFNRVGYRGVVMPNAIKKIYVFTSRDNAQMFIPEWEFASVNDFLNSMDDIKEFCLNNIDLDESKKVLPPYEKDEFEIGDEGGNNEYFHINESIDASEIGEVEYSWDFDEDEYNEWIAENGVENSEETLFDYVNDYVSFDLEYFDNETRHHYGYDSVDFDGLIELFGEKKANEILSDCRENGGGRFETCELFNDDEFDINNSDELNAAVIRQMPHGEYYKNARGFILTNGVMAYTEQEHNAITSINGIKDKFQFIRLGNIRVLPNSIDIGKKPTNEQIAVLRDIINSYTDEELYLDIFTQQGSEIGVKYTRPNWRKVIGEINRYYSEGIRPMGDSMNENVELELNADEVSLKSFKKNDTLAFKLWDGFKLNPRARLRLLDIADDFWDTTDVSWVKPSGIILTGSICNFNWSKYSDIDLHLVVNFSEVDERKDFVQEYFDAKKNEWNNSHKGLKIYGYPVEIYVEDIDAETESGGIYDLEENKWIKKPSKDEIKPIGLNKYDIKNLVAKYCTKIDNLCDQADATDDKHILGEIGKRANKLLNRIKKMRKFGLERSGEGDPFNIAYKCYRRMGYLDKLFDIKSELYDRIKSISESKVIRESSDDIFEIAKERFGVTYDIRECGYILPDGSMLDFTGLHQVTGDTSHLKGRRSVDHREISVLNYEIDGKTKTGLNISMEEFIKMGAIRVHSSSTWGTINLFAKPTQQQIDVLLRLIRYSKGCVTVEIGDGDESLSYGEYEEAKPRKVVTDILRYFDEGINLEGDVNESKKTVVISDGQLELIKEYLDKDYNMPLYKYFKWADNANDDEKAESLAWTNAYHLIDYLVNLIEVGKIDNEKDIELITNASDDYYDEDGYIEQFIEIIKKYKLSSHFISWCYDKINYVENPAWMYMSFIRPVKNEWCIHFGSDSDNIAREGFTGGTYELDYLAYTNAGEDKPYEGYDFAFLIDDRNVDFNNYGNEAVIFQTSGVLCYHYGDEQKQVIFWGPYAKNFIPIKYDEYEGEWVVKGMKDQILKSGKPSEIAEWATENLPQYRKQIMAGKNGYIPKYYDYKQNKLVPYKKYRNDESIHQIKSILNENVSSYIKLLKEEINARGNASHDIYRKRWNQEREMLKRFLKNNGTIMTSKENGKTYYVYYDTMLSNLIGINYCVCIQYDMLTGELGHQIYVRAIDKFSQKIFSPRNDTRGRDNKSTLDDTGNYSNFS